MKWGLGIGGLLMTVVGVGVLVKSIKTTPNLPTTAPQTGNNSTLSKQTETEVIAENLTTPWGIAFLPNGELLATERVGRVRLIDAGGHLQIQPVLVLEAAKEYGEGGLLGITQHPDFIANHLVYLYYTYQENDGNTLNRVARMTYQNQRLVNEQVIIDQIPGASIHNGGRIKFGPDRYLYVTTGDANNPSQAQDLKSLAGKVLRVTDSGQAAPGNPFGNLVYSYGHRNPQGLAWDSEGRLWESEHGPSGTDSGDDEINLIEPAKNYGWPVITGNQTHTGMKTAVLNSGNNTWAPAGAAIINNQLFWGALRGQALYEFNLATKSLTSHFMGEYGRIRDVVVGPDGMLYITTSNRDSRGIPRPGDDKVVRINPKLL